MWSQDPCAVSAYTETKQQRFAGILPLIYTDTAKYPYVYYDLFAGPGILEYRGRKFKGSPLIFLDQGYQCTGIVLCELNYLRACQLIQLAESRARVVSGSCERWLSSLLRNPPDSTTRGLIYADPCNGEVPVTLLSQVASVLPYVDILLHVSAGQYKRRRPARKSFISGHIDVIGKKTVMVTYPETMHQWTFILMTNRNLVASDWSVKGFYSHESVVGTTFMREIDKSSRERERKDIPMGMRAEKIGPEEAARYLDSARTRDEEGNVVGGMYSFANRRIERRRVDIYARKMATGHVDSGGQYDPDLPLIAFDEEDKLCGGFHNLLAVIKSGTTWEFSRVKRGVKQHMRPALNESRSGTSRDALMEVWGWSPSYAGTGAAVARLLLNFESGSYGMYTSKVQATDEVAKRADQDRELIEEAINAANQLYSRFRVNRNIAATAFTVFALHMGAEKTRDLFTKLATGIGIKADEPAAWLQNKLERLRPDDRRMGGGPVPNRIWVAFLIAGEAAARGRAVARVTLPRTPDARQVREFVWWDKTAK